MNIWHVYIFKDMYVIYKWRKLVYKQDNTKSLLMRETNSRYKKMDIFQIYILCEHIGNLISIEMSTLANMAYIFNSTTNKCQNTL